MSKFCIVLGDQDSNPGQQRWYGPNSLGSRPGHCETCTNFEKLYLQSPLRNKDCLASVAHAVTQAFGGEAELEDGSRTDV